MTNYIIKNCPSYVQGSCFTCDNICQNIPSKSCKLKQIVEKCIWQSHIPEVDDLKEDILNLLK